MPPEVAAIVTRAIRRNRDNRFASAEAMLDAVRGLVGSDLTLRESMLPDARDSGRRFVDPLATTQEPTRTGPG